MAVKTKAVQAPVMPATAEEKKKALETALDQIEKRFGKGAKLSLLLSPPASLIISFVRSCSKI